MASIPKIFIYDNHSLACSINLHGTVELGRQNENEDGPYFRSVQPTFTRIVIASSNEITISRKFLRVEPCGDQRVLLSNISSTNCLALADGSVLAPDGFRELLIPISFNVGNKTVCIRAAHGLGETATAMVESAIALAADPNRPGLFPALKARETEDAKILLRWLHSTMGVFQSAAGSQDFFAKAAQAVIDIVGLDSGQVLLLQGDKWCSCAIQMAPREDSATEIPPSPAVEC